LNNIFVITVYLILKDYLGIWSIAWASVAGSLVQYFFLFPIILKRKYFAWKISLSNSSFTKVIGLGLPLFFGSIIYRSNSLIERYFASGFGEGRITYLNYGYKMISSLAVVVISGIQTIGFVKFSQISARKDYQRLKNRLYLALGVGFSVLLPSFLSVFLFSNQIISFFLERGNFSREASLSTALALKYYSPAIISMALGGLISTALYSLYKTNVVVVINIVTMGVYVLLSWLFISRFNYLGLAISYCIANWLQFIIYFLVIRRELNKKLK
jgi:putative peptidoglycan lipid II flippase